MGELEIKAPPGGGPDGAEEITSQGSDNPENRPNAVTIRKGIPRPVLLYLFIAAGSVTHRDLFLQPFLNVDLPLLGFFVLGPLIFLIVDAYVLLHFVLLAGKVGDFDAELRAQLVFFRASVPALPRLGDQLRTRPVLIRPFTQIGHAPIQIMYKYFN